MGMTIGRYRELQHKERHFAIGTQSSSEYAMSQVAHCAARARTSAQNTRTLYGSTEETRAHASRESSQMAEETPNFTRVPSSSLHEPGFEMTAGSEPVHDLDSFEDGTDPEQDRETKYPAGNSSAVGAVANFVNSIIGAGVIGLPFSMAQVRGAFVRGACLHHIKMEYTRRKHGAIFASKAITIDSKKISASVSRVSSILISLISLSCVLLSAKLGGN